MRALLLVLALLAAGCLEPADGPGSAPTSGTPVATTVPTLAGPTPTVEPTPSATPTPVPTRPPEPDVEHLSFRTLAQGSFSPIGEDLRVYLTDAGAWADVWARHSSEPVPEVEFPNESVVAVVVHGPTGCAGANIGNVTSAERGVTVEVVHEYAPPEIQCFVAFEDVYHFAAVPHREGPVRFVDVRIGPSGYTMRTIEQGGTSGIEDRRRDIIRDADTWRAFWSEHARPQLPPPEAPSIDFEREHVFVATSGTRPNTCHGIGVDRVELREDAVHVVVTTRGEKPDQICGQAITHPFHYVTYPVTDLPIRITEETA